MTWFETLTGVTEESGDHVRARLRLEGQTLTSLANGHSMVAGEFITPTLSSLRDAVAIPPAISRTLRVCERVGDVKSLHQDPSNEHAVFQVASQFNCLEMASPHVTPEAGVGIYQNDWTQGPACSVCAGAGTIVRNYFATVKRHLGQSSENQIDCLSEMGSYFGNDIKKLWRMQNGYCFPTSAGLATVEQRLSECNELERDQIRGQLKVGVQRKTEVTVGESNHLVTQVFCSALPVAYSDIPLSQWNHFPRLILEAAYEATFYVALQNLQDTGCNKLYLTLVGGGVFGNRLEWILAAIDRSLKIFASTQLDVSLVSYKTSNRDVANFVAKQ